MENKKSIGEIKDILLFNLIRYLYKYIKRKYLFNSIKCFHTKDGISGSGIKYYIIGNDCEPIIDCSFIEKNNNIGFISSLFNQGYITKEQYIEMHGLFSK